MWQILVNGIFEAAIILLAALGFSLIYGTARFFNLAHGAVYMIGGYAAYVSASHLKWGLLPSLLLAFLTSAMAGVMMESFVYKPLRKHRAPSLIYLISSLGLLLLFQNLAGILFGNENLVVSFNTKITEGFDVIGTVVSEDQLIILVVSVLSTALLFVFMKTKVGLSLKGLADNCFVARAIGIDIDRMMLITFFIGSGLGGIAGALVAMETTIKPSMGFSGTFYAMLACIIGGAGNLTGAILGSCILGMVGSLGVALLAPEWKDTLALGVLVVLLFIRPHGLMKSQQG